MSNDIINNIINSARGLRAAALQDIDAHIKTLTPLAGYGVKLCDSAGVKTLFEDIDVPAAKAVIIPWSGFIVNRSDNIGVYRHINGVVPPDGWYMWLGGVFTSNGMPCVYEADGRSSIYYNDGRGHILVRGNVVEQRYIQPRILIQPGGRTYHVDQGPVDTSETDWLDNDIYGTQYDDYYNERLNLIVEVSHRYSYPDFDLSMPVEDRPMAYDTSFGAKVPACIKLLAAPDSEARLGGGVLAWEMPQSIRYSALDDIELLTLQQERWNHPGEEYWDNDDVDPFHRRGRRADLVDAIMRDGDNLPAYVRNWLFFAVGDAEKFDGETVKTRTIQRGGCAVFSPVWELYNFGEPSEAGLPNVELAEPGPAVDDPLPPTAVLIRRGGVAVARLIKELVADFVPPMDGPHRGHQAKADAFYSVAISIHNHDGTGDQNTPAGAWESLEFYISGTGDENLLNPYIAKLEGYISDYENGDIGGLKAELADARAVADEKEYGPDKTALWPAIGGAQSEAMSALDNLQARIEALGG